MQTTLKYRDNSPTKEENKEENEPVNPFKLSSRLEQLSKPKSSTLNLPEKHCHAVKNKEPVTP